MQPTFLPWQGYFSLIDSVDVFVFLDDVQFVRRSFHHRNRLFVAPDRVGWVSLPVEHGGVRQTLLDSRVMYDPRFVRKTRACLEHVYRRSSFFEIVYDKIFEPMFRKESEKLSEININLIERISSLMGIGRKFLRSSDICVEGVRSKRIINILLSLGAGGYISAAGSYDYMAADGLFPTAAMPVVFQDFEPQIYSQRTASTFVPYLSVIDALFEVGPDATRSLIRKGNKPFLPWEMREALGREVCDGGDVGDWSSVDDFGSGNPHQK